MCSAWRDNNGYKAWNVEKGPVDHWAHDSSCPAQQLPSIEIKGTSVDLEANWGELLPDNYVYLYGTVGNALAHVMHSKKMAKDPASATKRRLTKAGLHSIQHPNIAPENVKKNAGKTV
jgi:hypothetical protein